MEREIISRGRLLFHCFARYRRNVVINSRHFEWLSIPTAREKHVKLTNESASSVTLRSLASTNTVPFRSSSADTGEPEKATMHWGRYRPLVFVVAFAGVWNIRSARSAGNCEEEGIRCDCATKDVFDCIPNGNGSFVELVVDTCEDYRHCWRDPDEPCKKNMPASCAYALGPENVFQCTDPGLFVDPLSCTDYFICTVNGGTLTAHRQECHNNKWYNPKTSLCDQNLDCPGPPIDCVEGTIQALDSNPRFYYICIDMKKQHGDDPAYDFYYPLVFRCPGGEIFQNGKCRKTRSTRRRPNPIVPGP